MITGDVNVARSALDRMAKLVNHPNFDKLPGVEQTRVLKAVRTLRKQISDYDHAAEGGAMVSHTPAKTTYTPRKTGKLPSSHPLRKVAPAGASSYEREEQYEH